MKVITAFLLILTTSFSVLAQDGYYHCSKLPQPEAYVGSNFKFENEILLRAFGARVSKGTKEFSRFYTTYFLSFRKLPNEGILDRVRITPSDQFIITSARGLDYKTEYLPDGNMKQVIRYYEIAFKSLNTGREYVLEGEIQSDAISDESVQRGGFGTLLRRLGIELTSLPEGGDQSCEEYRYIPASVPVETQPHESTQTISI